MDSKIEIFGRSMDLTENMHDYAQKKVSRLVRFLNDIDETRVDLAYEKSARNAADRQVAQITIHGKGFILRTEERADDLFAAIDAATEKMQRQIERLKGKRQRGRGDGKSAADVTPEAITENEEPISALTIARRKEFTLYPMDETEALEQMILLGHDNFFVFYNANTNSINVLYRRRDGTYGLISPKVG
jgi:putative sigma-54 modulation protein